MFDIYIQTSQLPVKGSDKKLLKETGRGRTSTLRSATAVLVEFAFFEASGWWRFEEKGSLS